MPSSNTTGPSIPPPLLTSIQSDLNLALAQLTALHTAHAHTAASLARLAHLVGGDDRDTSLVRRLAAIQAAVDGEPCVRDSPRPASKAYADASIQTSSALAPRQHTPSATTCPVASHEHPRQPVRLSAATAQWLVQLLHDALLQVTPADDSHTVISANNLATLHEVIHPSDDAQPSHNDLVMSSERMLGDTAQIKDPSGCVLIEDGALRLPTPLSLTEDRARMCSESELPVPLAPVNASVSVQKGYAGGAAEDVNAAMDDASLKSVEASLSGTPILTRKHASHDAPLTDETPHDATASEPDPDDSDSYAYIRLSSPAVPRTSPPLTSSITTTPSRYVTPFEAAGACVGEEAAWHALVDENGLEGESEGENAPITPLAVDPALLHVDKPSSKRRERETHALMRSVSPLTPLDQSDGEATNVDRDRGEITAIGMAPSLASLGAFKLGAPTAPVPVGIRAASKAMPSLSLLNADARVHAITDPREHSPSLAVTRRIVGGPTASVEELALLARRMPLRIRVRVPEGTRGAKRSWDAERDEDAIDRIAEAGAPLGNGVDGDTMSDVPASRRRTKKAREHDQRDESTPGSKAPFQDSSLPSASAARHQARRGARMPTRMPQEVTHSRMSSSVQFTLTKKDVHTAVVRDDSQWPALPSVFLQWDTQFIQCDNCDNWYHYGCVGVPSGDPRLEPSAVYICPTCHNQSARRQTSRLQSESCARPDCPRPQASSDADHFFVEKLVGRKKVDGYMYLWLAKWEGYPMTQATWIPRENVDGDGTKLFNGFIEAALEEGVDLAREVVLLQEAIDAGWDSDAC